MCLTLFTQFVTRCNLRQYVVIVLDAENELRLPILILNDDNKTEIFSSNSAACYLFGELTNNTTWLEWEASILLPALINKPANNNKCTAELLKYLDASLKNKFLFGVSYIDL